MYYLFELGRNGLLEADIMGNQGTVHFDEPERTNYGKKVPIKGNTYPFKDDIKAADWDTTHHEWTGDYWRVDLEPVSVVVESLCEVADTVTADPEVVYQSDSLAQFRGKIEIDEDSGETFEFLRGPVEGDERVSRSWAEDAAETGNFDSVEEFADRFNFDVVDDEVLFDDYDDSTAEVGGGLVGSGDA